MENHNHGSAAPPTNSKGGSGSPAKNKDVAVAVPNHGSAAVVSATVAAARNDDVSKSKGKSVAADDDKELKPHIVAERKRRGRMRDYFGELQALMPQIPEKSGKGDIVGHAIEYIKSLEKTKATLEGRKLARQAGAEAAASSSSAPPPPPQTAQGMALAAMSSSSDVPDACSHVAPLPPQTAGPSVGFQTWSWPDIVLTVSNGNAYMNVCAPRHRGMGTLVMVLSVLDKYGIDVVMVQVDSDAVRSVFNICARVTAMGEEIPPLAVEVYQLAVSEILVWLSSS